MERCAEGEGGESVVEDHCAAEAEVGYQHDDPGDETGDCGDVCEPVEHVGTTVADIEESETADGKGE